MPLLKVARKINFNHFLENTYYQQTKYYLNSEGDLAFNIPKFDRTNDEINRGSKKSNISFIFSSR